MLGYKGWSFAKLLLIISLPLLTIPLASWLNPPPAWHAGQVVPVRGGSLEIVEVTSYWEVDYVLHKKHIYLWVEKIEGQASRVTDGDAGALRHVLARLG